MMSVEVGEAALTAVCCSLLALSVSATIVRASANAALVKEASHGHLHLDMYGWMGQHERRGGVGGE